MSRTFVWKCFDRSTGTNFFLRCSIFFCSSSTRLPHTYKTKILSDLEKNRIKCGNIIERIHLEKKTTLFFPIYWLMYSRQTFSPSYLANNCNLFPYNVTMTQKCFYNAIGWRRKNSMKKSFDISEFIHGKIWSSLYFASNFSSAIPKGKTKLDLAFFLVQITDDKDWKMLIVLQKSVLI